MRGDGNDRDGRESGSTDGAREAKTRRDVEDGHNPGTARGGGRSSADASTTVDEGERERGSVKRFPPRNSESEEAGAGTTETSGGGERAEGNGDVEARGERADDDDAGAQKTTRGGESGEIFAGGCGGARGGVERGRGGGAGAVRERVREQRGAETSRRRARSRERVRCELRAFADMFFATAWASFALTTRVAGTGLGMAKRASERSLSAARRRGAGDDEGHAEDKGARRGGKSARRGWYRQIEDPQFVRGDARCEGQGERGDEEFRRRQARHSGGPRRSSIRV